MKGNVCFLEDLTRLIQAGKRTELAHRLRPEAAVVSGEIEIYGREAAARWLWEQPQLTTLGEPRIQMLSGQLMLQRGTVQCAGKPLRYGLVIDVLLGQLVHLTLLEAAVKTESAATSGRSSDLELLLTQTQKFWLEWDLCQDTLRVSENWFAHFHFQPALSNLFQDPARRQHSLSGAQIAEIQSQLRQGKPVPPIELSLRCGGKDFRWYKLELTAEKDGQGQPVKVLGLVSDIDQQRRELHWLRRLAHHDCLTGLYNRFKIQQLIEETLRCAPEGKRMTLAVMDIDNFKQINDAYGHDCGDEALRQTAAEIRELFAPEDLVGRIGGDEFVVLLQEAGTGEQASARLEQIRQKLQHRHQPPAVLTGISCSIGCAFFPVQGTTYRQLFLKADAALIQAKRQGKNSCVFY